MTTPDIAQLVIVDNEAQLAAVERFSKVALFFSEAEILAHTIQRPDEDTSVVSRLHTEPGVAELFSAWQQVRATEADTATGFDEQSENAIAHDERVIAALDTVRSPRRKLRESEPELEERIASTREQLVRLRFAIWATRRKEATIVEVEPVTPLTAQKTGTESL